MIYKFFGAEIHPGHHYNPTDNNAELLCEIDTRDEQDAINMYDKLKREHPDKLIWYAYAD